MVTHSKDRPKPYNCTVCGTNFSTRRVLVTHARREHGVEVSQYGCIRCGQEFGNSKGLYMQHVLQCNRERRIEAMAGRPPGQRRQLPPPKRKTENAGISSTEHEMAQHMLQQITGELPVEEAVVETVTVLPDDRQADMDIVEGVGTVVREMTHQEIVTQLAEEIVLDHPEQSVQYMIVDPDGNVLETIEMNNLAMSQVKVEAGDGDEEELVAFSMPVKVEIGGQQSVTSLTVPVNMIMEGQAQAESNKDKGTSGSASDDS